VRARHFPGTLDEAPDWHDPGTPGHDLPTRGLGGRAGDVGGAGNAGEDACAPNLNCALLVPRHFAFQNGDALALVDDELGKKSD
jgi:hypothetical protein